MLANNLAEFVKPCFQVHDEPRCERPGLAFQNFVWSLERAISGPEGVTVETSKRLIDKDTGRLREHDVVITWSGAHHTITTAIECKETGRKVGVPQGEAFAKKCDRTGVHHRVIVSATGFYDTARAKAAAQDIVCMELSEASAFDWVGMEFFVCFERQFNHSDATVFFTGDNPLLVGRREGTSKPNAGKFLLSHPVDDEYFHCHSENLLVAYTRVAPSGPHHSTVTDFARFRG